MNHRSIRTVAELSIYVALAFIFGYLENLFPIPMAGSRHETGICQCDHCDRSIPEKFQRRFARFPSSDYFECLYIWKSLQFAVQPGRQSVKSVYYDSYKKKNLPGPGQCQCCRRYLPQPGTIYNRWSFGGFPALIYYAPLLYFAGLISGILIGILCNCVLNLVP